MPSQKPQKTIKFLSDICSTTLLSAEEERALFTDFLEAETSAWQAIFSEAPHDELLNSLKSLTVGMPKHLKACIATRKLTPLAVQALRNGDAFRPLLRGLSHSYNTGKFKRCIEIRNTIVSHNYRLVVKRALKYTSAQISQTELISEGIIGLIRAVEKYDLTRGLRFSTPAVWWIRRYIAAAVAEKTRTIAIPIHVQTEIAKLRRQVDSLEEAPRFPTSVVSIDEISQNGTDGSSSNQVNLLAAKFRDPVDLIDKARANMKLRDCLLQLSDIERSVICSLFGIGVVQRNKASIAKEHGIDTAAVERLIEAAIGKCRSAFELPGQIELFI